MTKQADKMRGKLRPSAPTEAPAPGDPLAPGKPLTWEQRHKRATFHLDRELLAQVKAAAAAEGSTVSGWVAAALRAALDR